MAKSLPAASCRRALDESAWCQDGDVHDEPVLLAAVQDHFFLATLEQANIHADRPETVVRQHLVQQVQQFGLKGGQGKGDGRIQVDYSGQRLETSRS